MILRQRLRHNRFSDNWLDAIHDARRTREADAPPGPCKSYAATPFRSTPIGPSHAPALDRNGPDAKNEHVIVSN